MPKMINVDVQLDGLSGCLLFIKGNLGFAVTPSAMRDLGTESVWKQLEQLEQSSKVQCGAQAG